MVTAQASGADARAWFQHEPRGLEIYPPVLLAYLDHIPALLDKQFAGGGEVVQLCNYLQDFVFSFFREHLLVGVQIADLDAKKPDWFREMTGTAPPQAWAPS